MTCRRCSECPEGPHHWLDNGDFGADAENAESPTGNAYVCKHCDAVGDDCEACQGTGVTGGFRCPLCRGTGIVETQPRSYEEFEATLTVPSTRDPGPRGAVGF